ncbi:hypothetical protein [uncultured Subdoligranulum sp.]|uniref:hypothetical protein n=1 Tax=uncultured Subdoligranulum sp. TaxID=512298 RepID=UPI0025E2D4F8|nr:hypothetical protein [uncultured Subdoligranulum sp.]
MHQTKTAAPVLAHRNGQKTQGIAKSCILIVHKLPPLLGLTAWRPGLTLAGLALLAVGCAVEVMTE